MALPKYIDWAEIHRIARTPLERLMLILSAQGVGLMTDKPPVLVSRKLLVQCSRMKVDAFCVSHNIKPTSKKYQLSMQAVDEGDAFESNVVLDLIPHTMIFGVGGSYMSTALIQTVMSIAQRTENPTSQESIRKYMRLMRAKVVDLSTLDFEDRHNLPVNPIILEPVKFYISYYDVKGNDWSLVMFPYDLVDWNGLSTSSSFSVPQMYVCLFGPQIEFCSLRDFVLLHSCNHAGKVVEFLSHDGFKHY